MVTGKYFTSLTLYSLQITLKNGKIFYIETNRAKDHNIFCVKWLNMLDYHKGIQKM